MRHRLGQSNLGDLGNQAFDLISHTDDPKPLPDLVEPHRDDSLGEELIRKTGSQNHNARDINVSSTPAGAEASNSNRRPLMLFPMLRVTKSCSSDISRNVVSDIEQIQIRVFALNIRRGQQIVDIPHLKRTVEVELRSKQSTILGGVQRDDSSTSDTAESGLSGRKAYPASPLRTRNSPPFRRHNSRVNYDADWP